MCGNGYKQISGQEIYYGILRNGNFRILRNITEYSGPEYGSGPGKGPGAHFQAKTALNARAPERELVLYSTSSRSRRQT